MKMCRVVRSVLVVLACLGSGVCVSCSSTSKVEAHGTTTGQELKDLEDARNKGLLTEDEYQKKRRQILDRK